MTILAPDLEARAESLELRAATRRLVSHLLPDHQGATPVGRTAFLMRIVEGQPALRQALLAEDDEAIRWKWADAAAAQRSDITFFHGLAVLYRDQALASLRRGVQADGYWITATALWVLLLTSERFWATFWSERESDQSRDELLDECLRSVLSLHGTLGPRAFASGAIGHAKMHIHCLDLCARGTDQLVAALRDCGITWEFRSDRVRFARAASLAKELIDKWSKSVVLDAQRELEDPERLKRLSEGLRKNYDGGIKKLQQFIGLGVHDLRVLTAALQWSNDWCYDLYVTDELEQIKRLMGPARQVADQLAPLSARLQPFKPENEALSRHYMLRGFILDDAAKAIEQYAEALAWNDQNTNARELLKGQERRVLMGEIKTAAAHATKKEWSEANRILERIQSQVEGADADEVSRMHSVVCFNHAQALAEDGRCQDALAQAQKARQLDPDEPLIDQLIVTLKTLAAEEPNVRLLRAAREAFEADRFEQAIETAKKVPSRSALHPQARDIQAAARFYRGIERANGGELEAGIADLTAALELVDDADYRDHIAEQLAAMREANRGRALGDAIRNEDWARAEQIVRSFLDERSLSRDDRRNLEAQLSQVLVALAVKTVNDSQEDEMQFASALTDVLARLHQRPEVR